MTERLSIAVFVSEFPALSETFVLNQITGLIDLGHDVTIIADKRRSELSEHINVKQYQLLKRTHYWSRLLRLLLRGYTRRSWVIQPLVLRIIGPWLEGRQRYDIVLCHFGTNGLRALALRDAGILAGKIVTVFHGYDVSQFLKIFGDGMYERLFIEGDYFLPISEHWKSKLIALGCPKDLIEVHRTGIDMHRFKLVHRQRTYDEPIRFVSVARLVEKKGIEYAVAAVDQLVREHSDLPVKYTVIGDGPLRKELEAQASRSAASRAIEFVGSKESGEVAATLSQSHIFLAPSVTSRNGDQEGIPVAIMEAMATGLPVISTFHTGIPELIDDGASGFLVLERDAAQLAERMFEVATNSERWTAIASAARERVVSLHDTSRLNLELEQILHKISGGGH